jgi:hypothetical protein
MTTYDLGLLLGGYIRQYSNAVGQSYYHNTINNETSYSIPPGFEDSPLVSLYPNLNTKTYPHTS